MSLGTSIAFVAIFLVVYALVSFMVAGAIHWPGIVGGVIGAVTAYFLSSWMRRNRDQSAD
ncbi:MAG: hypothetical protein EA415_01990 [Sphaerobacteraceae bacterium]|nr:MAG: hypothetical protein EA415_01990 [Sphaerobacteraceae bacterium]